VEVDGVEVSGGFITGFALDGGPAVGADDPSWSQVFCLPASGSWSVELDRVPASWEARALLRAGAYRLRSAPGDDPHPVLHVAPLWLLLERTVWTRLGERATEILRDEGLSFTVRRWLPSWIEVRVPFYREPRPQLLSAAGVEDPKVRRHLATIAHFRRWLQREGYGL
jgi:hypothetical protein